MNVQLTKKTPEGKYHIQRPSPHKKEYHGNGKNSWPGQTEVINGHAVEYRSRRYSYRWHKTQVFFDGQQLLTAQDYKKAEAILNGEG